ncbi:MAG: NAD-glutamate dehydrogenase [Candidatus Aminicenantes bacterium]|nr:NAD-glutamate dehydrogenase [Candidatus Aminicenantes bacterium]
MKSLKEIASHSILTEEQLAKLEKLILAKGEYSPETVREELDWFCTKLGMNDYYFRTTPLETMADHIQAIKAAEIIATIGEKKSITIDLSTEQETRAVYLVDDVHQRALEIEKRIEKKYPHCRLQCYRTQRKAPGLGYLRMYVACLPKFKRNNVSPFETNIELIADETFLATSPPETISRYARLLRQTKGWESPYIEVTPLEKTKETRIVVVTKKDDSRSFFSNVSDVFNSRGLVSTRKYIEQFANGRTVFSFYLPLIEDKTLLDNIIQDITLLYVIPDSPLSLLFREGKLTAQETVFGVAAWSFAHQFLTGFNEEYERLAEALKDSPELQGLLRNLRTKLVKDTYHEQRVWDAYFDYYPFLRKLFALFDRKFNPQSKDRNIQDDLEQLKQEINQGIPVEIDRQIVLAATQFIKSILKTNFYLKEKTSLAFLYDPNFLNPIDYPEKPYSIIHVISAEMRGFHVRFRDIARGGIRIVRSTNLQNYLHNSDFIFDENYNLAWTQLRKNKDIPEGGSKGTILLNWGYQESSEVAFKKYIDGLLDLMLPNKDIVDYYGAPIILFIGPDEGTAELMAWAAERAKVRGYRYWRSFSTGKPVSMGGIPHDLYGMTTNSIHEYVLASLNQLGLKEEEITKVMTGGPDGDLGSNEILISKDKILAIIDGSGVLYDPKGINRKELVRLARLRKPVEFFRRELLSPEGFLVTIKDKNVLLPDGEKVPNGLDFRNSFHLHPKFKADLFVPCGGRPSSININNWHQLIDDKGQPRFRLIVEGANLFLTQPARLRLEEKGVIIYKDASANKGGVTSSSLEVLASLALTDKEYEELMCVHNGRISEFRKAYIKEILAIIRENARLEWAIIWKEHEKRGLPRSVLSDLISEKIVQIKDAVYASDLYKNKALFRRVISCCLPSVLLKKVGFARLLQRLPENYKRALFASYLASRYVYKYGLEANEVNFTAFLNELQRPKKS